MGLIAKKYALKNLDVPSNTTSSIKVSLPNQRKAWEIDIAKLIISLEISGGFLSAWYYRQSWGFIAVKPFEVEIAGYRTQAFEQEVSMWTKLDHPNIIKFIGTAEKYDKFSQRDVCVMGYEHFRGPTLEWYLRSYPRFKLPLEDVIRFSLDLAKGLNYLHSQNIIHRSVKTRNVVVDETRGCENKVRITALGVGHLGLKEIYMMPDQIETPGYIAPEVLDGKRYDSKSDVYSFGICLWEIYCCDNAHPPGKLANVWLKIVNKAPKPKIPQCCPKILAELMNKCWESDPTKRPEMKEVVSILEHISKTGINGLTIPYCSDKSHGRCRRFASLNVRLTSN